jgi:DNA-binding transcriptional MerR regulator
MAAPLMSIGELAARTGVTTRTIRFYEEREVLPLPGRTTGGTRRYPPEYIFFVEGAIVLRDLGFSVEEIRLISMLSRGTDLSDGERERSEAAVDRLLELLEHKMRVLEFVRLAAKGGRGDVQRAPDRAEFAALLGIGSDEDHDRAARS